MSDLTEFLIRAFAAGFGGALAIMVVVFVSGQTFGQRCEAYFPDSTALQRDECVEFLRSGEPLDRIDTLLGEQ